MNEIFETLPDTGDDYDTAVAKLTEYFAPNKNAKFEIYKFRQAKQEAGESIDTFHTRLRQLSLTCEFAENDKGLKSQIIQGCNSTRLRRRALREDMSLNDLLKLARSMEISNRQASEIEKADRSTNDVNAIRKRRNATKFLEKKHKTQHHKDARPNDKCYFCGVLYPHRNGRFPARGKTCNSCHKPDHFASVCQSKNKPHVPSKSIKQLDKAAKYSDSESESEEYVFGLGQINSVFKQPQIKVEINGIPVTVLVDTGSSINAIDEKTFEKIRSKVKLRRANNPVFAYGSNTKLEMIGKFTATIENEKKIGTAEVFVAKGNYGCILGYDTCIEMQIVPRIATTVCENKIEK